MSAGQSSGGKLLAVLYMTRKKLRQLEEQKVQHLKMAELNRMEHQLDGLLRLTRSTKEQAMRNAMSAIHEKECGQDPYSPTRLSVTLTTKEKEKQKKLLKSRLPKKLHYLRLPMRITANNLFMTGSSTTTAPHDRVSTYYNEYLN
ncbi:hypothetical protein AgCh_030651 [Apium graveolens]